MANYNSKHAIVSRSPYELYMAFVDMRNFVSYLPEDKKKGIAADYDSIRGNLKGFELGVKITDRVPYSKITIEDDNAPFEFSADLHFDAHNGEIAQTDFSIELDVDLNFMTKMLIGPKIGNILDKIVDGMAAVSEGRMPDGVDKSFIDELRRNAGF